MKAFFYLLLLTILSTTGAFAQIEPDAGKWKTWVMAAGNEITLPPPPSAKATKEELKVLLALQAQRNDTAIRQIQYWDAGAPGYRWNQIAKSLAGPGMPPFRLLALVNVAIYDATVIAWQNKYTFRRHRPAQESGSLHPFIPDLPSPSYPCEHAVAAGAAATVLGYLFPAKADSLLNIAQAAGQSRLMAGVQYPSDVKVGYELGRQVAEKVIARARQDGSGNVWQGILPNKPNTWRGKNPAGATMGAWKTWVLKSGNQFRPGPPPDYTQDMAELKQFKPTNQSTARAFYFATQDFWFDLTNQKIFEYNLSRNAPRAARVYALKSIAAYDAAIACWDAKYTYWGIRPYEYDSTYHSLIGQPPFPGYPSGHATTSNAVATVLAYLFPDDGSFFRKKALECAESRFEGGLHFRTDNTVGLDLGDKVGTAVIDWAKTDGTNRPLQAVVR